ncbi:hypothetical protein F5887DRAFT_925386 [Amanita rubescens]|nr:hypothetical protein F5887DRAFT_925386 [Amanita rubescens]
MQTRQKCTWNPQSPWSPCGFLVTPVPGKFLRFRGICMDSTWIPHGFHALFLVQDKGTHMEVEGLGLEMAVTQVGIMKVSQWMKTLALPLPIRTPSEPGWEKAWLPKRKEFESSSYTSSAESYRPLTNASRALQSSVLKICREEGIDPAIIGWPLMPSGEPASLDELRKIQSWLLDNGLINEPEIEVVEKVATSKIPNIVIFDYEQRKGIRISKQMLKEARDDPEKWPGCVEVGMGIIHPLFLNHFGLEKCLSCKDGPRGKKKGKKDDPEYLTGCGCPVRTAALELWLTKVNAQNPAIPMREAEDGKIKRENAFNPTTLEFIEGGILAASGHTVDSLLQSEIGRLEHTANWAMDRMANLMQVENPAHCQTIAGVLVEFQKQMQGIKDQIRGQTIL